MAAQCFGAKNHDLLRHSCAVSLELALVIGVPCTVLFAALVRPVLSLMRTPSEIIDGSAAYLTVLAAGIVFTFINNVVFSLLRALGDSKTPLYVFIAASLLNIVLDIVLIAYTPWGVAAAAAATVVSQIFSALFCLRYLVKKTEMNFTRKDFAFDMPVMRELLRLGAPAGLRDFVSAMGGAAVQYIINGYGTVFIAGIASAKKLYSLLFIIGGGMEGASAVFTAQNYGSRRFDRIKKGAAAARTILLAGLVVIIPVMLLFGRKALGMFISGNDPAAGAVLDTAYDQLKVCLVFLPSLYMLLLYRSCLQGMGNSFIPMLSGFVEAGIRILAVAVLPLFFGVWGVYIAEAAGWPLMALQLYVAYFFVFKREARNQAVPHAGVSSGM
jgi:putative MATE family efflux protein